MKHAATRELYAYWNLIRGQRAAPERAQVDPLAIRGVLSDTFILEVDLERRFPFRIAGTRANALFMRELKGTSFLDLWCEEGRSQALNILDAILDEVSPAVGGLLGITVDRSPLDIELLLLPLRHNGRTHSRILGCLSPAAVPAWLGLVPIDGLNIRSLRILRDEATSDQFGREAAAATVGQRAAAWRRGHLIVHDGGR